MRSAKKEELGCDLTVVGGGLAGICCAVTAARRGLDVVLIQDRPLLGGNASSEVRLWILGATSHMGNNNRWAREGGVIDEILVENMWRNPEGNPVILDSLLLETVCREPRINLLLNSAVHEIVMADPTRVRAVVAFCSQNQTQYTVSSGLFVDASGDGIVGFLAGAEFRMGSESRTEFNEPLAPPVATNELLGHSLYFYSRDTGHPVVYVPPSFALSDLDSLPRFRELKASDSGCRLWWLEYGGNMDTVFDTEKIKWELWRVAYGVWNYIKNSGHFPNTENLTLEWVGMIPGKRESRRFIGDYTLTQGDIVTQQVHADAVSFGGWAIDLHPSDGVFSSQPSCTQWHSKGVYQIPYRSMYSRNIVNLFITGRLISASHIAFGSTRVMATCAHNSQAVGIAAALCREENLLPQDLVLGSHMDKLQQRLLRCGQHIPGLKAADPADLARQASITASSTMRIRSLEATEEVTNRDRPYALLMPAMPGQLPKITLFVNADQPTTLRAELWGSSLAGNTTPDILFGRLDRTVPAGAGCPVELDFNFTVTAPCHLFVIVPPIRSAVLRLSSQQYPGILTVSQKMNGAVAKQPVQTPPHDSGLDTFAFWLPDRRPAARNLAASFSPSLDVYSPEAVVNGFTRPWCGTNAWVPDVNDLSPSLQLTWMAPQTLRVIEVTLDTDFDHPMESVLMSHPERIMPGCIRAYNVSTEERMLFEVRNNHHTKQVLRLEEPVIARTLRIDVLEPGPVPSAIFEVRCY